MFIKNQNYKSRLIDKKIMKYLEVFGAISIEGVKWCGKTWSSLRHANSVIYMDDDENKTRAEIDVKSIFSHDKSELPQLIDEWNLAPNIWDATRRECDKTVDSGNYILTGSTTLPKKIQKKKIKHSGAGRIGIIKMSTMSLYESLDSSGKASIMDMYNGTQIVPRGYTDSILRDDMIDDEDKKRDKDKMLMLLKSLAQNESSIVSNNTIIKDIGDFESKDPLSSTNTLADYLDVLNRLYLLENWSAYSDNYRSRERVGKAPKRHFTDPSLACALLNLNSDKLLRDFNTFGLLFEGLVARDLRIYMDYLNGTVHHFRDNVIGLEVDAILEFEAGEYAAVEFKLGFNKVEDVIGNLQKISDNVPIL